MPAHRSSGPDRPHARVRPAIGPDAEGLAGEAPVRTAREWALLLQEPGARTVWVADRAGAVVGVLVARAVGPGHPRTLELELLRVSDDEPPATTDHLVGVALGDAPCFAVVGPGAEDVERALTRHGFTTSPTPPSGPGQPVMVR